MRNGRARPQRRGAPGRPVRRGARRALRSALRVLRGLAGLLEAVLLAFLDPRVTGEEAGLLQRRAVVRVVRDERPGDAEAQRAGLAGDAAATQVGDHVE